MKDKLRSGADDCGCDGSPAPSAVRAKPGPDSLQTTFERLNSRERQNCRASGKHPLARSAAQTLHAPTMASWAFLSCTDKAATRVATQRHRPGAVLTDVNRASFLFAELRSGCLGVRCIPAFGIETQVRPLGLRSDSQAGADNSGAIPMSRSQNSDTSSSGTDEDLQNGSTSREAETPGRHTHKAKDSPPCHAPFDLIVSASNGVLNLQRPAWHDLTYALTSLNRPTTRPGEAPPVVLSEADLARGVGMVGAGAVVSAVPSSGAVGDLGDWLHLSVRRTDTISVALSAEDLGMRVNERIVATVPTAGFVAIRIGDALRNLAGKVGARFRPQDACAGPVPVQDAAGATLGYSLDGSYACVQDPHEHQRVYGFSLAPETAVQISVELSVEKVGRRRRPSGPDAWRDVKVQIPPPAVDGVFVGLGRATPNPRAFPDSGVTSLIGDHVADVFLIGGGDGRRYGGGNREPMSTSAAASFLAHGELFGALPLRGLPSDRSGIYYLPPDAPVPWTVLRTYRGATRPGDWRQLMEGRPDYLLPERNASGRATGQSTLRIQFLLTIFPAVRESATPLIDLSHVRREDPRPGESNHEPIVYEDYNGLLFPCRVSVSTYDAQGTRTIFHTYSRSPSGLRYDSTGRANGISTFVGGVGDRNLALFVGGVREAMGFVQDTNITVHCISIRTAGVAE
jgi:hypothetical protein